MGEVEEARSNIARCTHVFVEKIGIVVTNEVRSEEKARICHPFLTWEIVYLCVPRRVFSADQSTGNSSRIDAEKRPISVLTSRARLFVIRPLLGLALTLGVHMFTTSRW